MAGRDEAMTALQCRAHAAGVHYLGSDPAQLSRILSGLEMARKGKPTCFLRSYSPTDRLCKGCDLRGPCGDKMIFPRFMLAPFEIRECFLVDCDGDLIIPLYNDGGEVVDLACSTPGCPAILSRIPHERR